MKREISWGLWGAIVWAAAGAAQAQPVIIALNRDVGESVSNRLPIGPDPMHLVVDCARPYLREFDGADAGNIAYNATTARATTVPGARPSVRRLENTGL